MKPKNPIGVLLIGLLTGGALLGLTARQPAAQAAPVAAKAPAGSLADLLSGKLYPTTLKRSDFTADYHIVGLIDAQGKPATFASKGETITLGGETFLVAYLMPTAPAPATPDAKAPVTVNPDAQLTLVNLRHVQALGGIHDLPPVPEAPKDTGTP